MIGFICYTSQTEIKLSCEVDDAQWIDYDKAQALVHPKGGGSVSAILVEKNYLEIEKQKS
jgi:NADH pyrophosphatase NudC (nudix superfamily)